MSSNLLKRVRLTKAQALLIFQHSAEAPHLTYNELSNWSRVTFKLQTSPSKQTIGRILQSGSKLLLLSADCLSGKKARSQHQMSLDQGVVEFVRLCELEKFCISGEMIMERAKEIADEFAIPLHRRPRFGWSWLRHLQARYGIRWKRAFGGSGSVDQKAAEPKLQQLRQIIHTYEPHNIYNMDETSFFYNQVPRGSLCFVEAPSLKQNKARVTMALCANADGSHKLPVLFLGKSVSPRWLPQKPDTILYAATAKAWMTIDMSQEWLLDFNQEMRAAERHVLLLIDNASSHSVEGIVLTNIRVENLPPNTTSKVQPMDQGIIYSVKRKVLHRKMKFALRKICTGQKSPYQVGLLRAIVWCEKEWGEISPQSIQNCWKHSGLVDKLRLSFLLN